MNCSFSFIRSWSIPSHYSFNSQRISPMNNPAYTQHFLNNRFTIQEMLNHAQISENDMVIDIGAGKGALTNPLSRKAKKVIAVELDRHLACSLKRSFGNSPTVKVLNLNFLDMPLPKNSFKVVANIPYNITTDIFGYLLDVPQTYFTGGVILMEWGAAKRFTEHSIDPRVIGWNTWFNISTVNRVSPQAFSPAPSVQSAMVKIDRRKQALVDPQKYYDYIAFVSSLLKHPKTRMRDAFKHIFTWNQIKRISRDAGINRDYLIANLTFSQWAHCFNTMQKLIPERMHPTMPNKYKKLYKR